MVTIYIVVISLLIYYMGQLYVTNNAFKNKKIKLSLPLLFLIPFYIAKTYIGLGYKHRKEIHVLKHVLLDLFFGYNTGLAVLVEVFVFGINNGYIKTDKRERMNFVDKVKAPWKQIAGMPFVDSLGDYLAY